MKHFFWPTVFCMVVTSCDLPRDTVNTLAKVENSKLYVGISQNPPWTLTGDTIGGVEVQLIQQFAKEIGADIAWVEGTESELAKKLEHQEIHLMIAGLEKKSVWEKEVALSKPYVDKKVMACRQGENAWLMRLEKFFKDHEKEMQSLLHQYQP